MSTDGADGYLPIDCSLHDRIEDLATRGRVVRIRYEGDEGPAETDDALVDWFVRDGAEFLRTGAGLEIRLDRILEVDGQPYA